MIIGMEKTHIHIIYYYYCHCIVPIVVINARGTICNAYRFSIILYTIYTRTIYSPCSPWEHDTFNFFFFVSCLSKLQFNRTPNRIYIYTDRYTVYKVYYSAMGPRRFTRITHYMAVSVAFARQHSRAVYNCSSVFR